MIVLLKKIFLLRKVFKMIMIQKKVLRMILLPTRVLKMMIHQKIVFLLRRVFKRKFSLFLVVFSKTIEFSRMAVL